MSGGCGDCEDNEIYQANMIATIKELEQKLSDSEADWIKMRDIAEGTQRKLDEAIEVIRFYGNEFEYMSDFHYGLMVRESLTYDKFEAIGKRARDFLAKIEGKL